MRKIISFIVCFLLVALTAMSFSACKKDGGNAESEVENTEKPSIVGTWKSNVDITESVKDTLSLVNPQMSKYLEVKSIKVPVTYVFNEDGTYKRTIEAAGLEKKLNKLEAAVPDAIKKYLEFMIEAHGLNTTPEAFCLENDKMTLEQEAEDFITKWRLARFLEEKEGKYKLDGDKLYMNFVGENAVDDDYYTIDLGFETTKIKAYSRDKDGIYVAKDLLAAKFTRE